MSSWFKIEEATEKNFWLVGVGEVARAKKEDVRGFEVRTTKTGGQVVLVVMVEGEAKEFKIGAEFGDPREANRKREELEKKYPYAAVSE